MSVNRIFLLGNLVRDPELRYTPNGVPVVQFTLAVNRPPRGEESKTPPQTDFIKVVAWKKLAEVSADLLKKGDSAAVEGRLRTRSYETADGQKRRAVEVEAASIEALGRREKGSVALKEGDSDIADFEQMPDVSVMKGPEITDDIPF